MSLLEISKKRQQTAHKIMSNLNLVPILSEVGDVHLVGSVVHGTVLKLDIDFHIELNKKYTAKEAVKYVRKHLTDSHIHDITTSVYKHLNGIVMECMYASRGDWSIDMFLCEGDLKSKRHESWIAKLMTTPKLKNILKLKAHYLRKKMLRMGMSYWIYEAVLKYGIKTHKDFEKHLFEQRQLTMDYFKKKSIRKNVI